MNRSPKKRGRRERRVRDRTGSLACKMEKAHEHSHRSCSRNTRHSLRNGFTAYFVLFPAIGFFVTVIPEKLASHELDASVEASEPHDLAVRLRRIRQSAIRVHHIPPRVRDDRDTPLEWGETEQVIKVICVFGKSEYFLKGAGQTPNQQTEEIC